MEWQKLKRIVKVREGVENILLRVSCGRNINGHILPEGFLAKRTKKIKALHKAIFPVSIGPRYALV